MESSALLAVALMGLLQWVKSDQPPAISKDLAAPIIEFSKTLREIELVLPEANKRNQQHCELYEDVVSNECRVECRAFLSLTNLVTVRGMDVSPRRLSACQRRGESCQKTLTLRNGFNVSVGGYCDACNCVAAANSLDGLYFAMSLRNPTSQQPGVKVEPTAPAKIQPHIKILIPDPSVRNATACEPYESMTTRLSTSLEITGCSKQCEFREILGRLRILGPPRILEGQILADGSRCVLKSLGIRKLFVIGECRAGKCVA